MRTVCSRFSAHRIMRPPTMNASATGTGWHNCALIAFPNARPSTASGTKAMARLRAKRCASRFEPRPEITAASLTRYSQHTARIAPHWITISNSLPLSSLKSSRSPARMRWPVLDTGRNSVSPSTTPSISALMRMTRSMGRIVSAGGYPHPSRRQKNCIRRSARILSLAGVAEKTAREPRRFHPRRTRSGFGINLRALFHELHRLLFHALRQRRLLIHALRCSVVAHVLGDFHRAEVRSAHRAEVRDLGAVLGQNLVVELARLIRIEAEVELIVPAKFEARLGQRVIADLC